MSDWHTLKLKEIGSVVTGKTPSSHNPEDFGSDMPFVTPTDYGNYGKWALAADRALSMSGIERLKGKVLPTDSILVTCIGSDMGKVVMNGFSVITNQQINAIIPDLERVVPDFAYYLLVHNYPTLRSYGESGTAVPILNKGDFEELEFEFPPIEEQRAIAEVLSSLDDKIDLLHRQNKTLESLGETLFRHWFIDQANDEWEEIVLADIADHRKDSISPSKEPNKVFHHYSIPAFDNGREPSEELGSTILSNKYKVIENSVMVSKLNPRTPRVWPILGSIDKSSISSTEFQIVKPKNNEHFGFIYNLLKSPQVTAELASASSGTSGSHQRARPEDIFGLTLSLPPNDLIEEFDLHSGQYLAKISRNNSEIRTLKNLRDLLLPKLMNGEVAPYGNYRQ